MANMKNKLKPATESPWPSATERQRVRTLKREAVLHAAVESFNEKGFNSTSLDDVSMSLNVTKPTIYHYFLNKDEVLFECVRIGLQSLQDALDLAGFEHATGRDRLCALMHAYAIAMTEDFGMCVVRTRDHELSDDSRKKFRALKKEIDSSVRKLVVQGMEDGSIPEGDPRMITFVLTGALNWVGHWFDDKGKMSAEDVAKGAVDVLIQGIAPQHIYADLKGKVND